jgi:hypothetical protein
MKPRSSGVYNLQSCRKKTAKKVFQGEPVLADKKKGPCNNLQSKWRECEMLQLSLVVRLLLDQT